MLGVACLSLLSLAGLSSAQDLGVPLSWREFSNDRSRDERISISQAAIDAILPQLDTGNGEFSGIGYWQSGNVWASMANEDHRAGTTVYQGQVVDQLNNVFNLHANYDQWGFNDDAMWWATAAYYAYRAYGDSTLLNYAITTWEHISTFAISQDNANSGSIPTKNFGFQGSCDGQSMVGGVFWKVDASDNGINGITTSLYSTLSAFLGEATGESRFIDAAIRSANWIKNVNMNSDYLVLDTVHATDCTRSPDNWLFTYNSGKYLEGLNVLADVTGDDAWKSLAVNVANAAMKTSAWQGSNGVITEGASPNENNDGVGFKSILLRALDETYNRRGGDNESLRILIHSYVCVQFNALLELAADGNNYSSAWAGPAQGFTTWGQMAALDVFVAAIHAA
ncbi:glycoside hydrolase family 76 protein [Schizophyllum amplum]|uniref:Glycoside hydrolase family 76 protein n=1 Tax=Schizophyllum amplum TaxID=97359 RepID=A0A550CUY3_9AGAR|nr:glycoside hydrolase family 76 protein [Auriculariopsis ampla]